MQIYEHLFEIETMISPLEKDWNFYPYNVFAPEQLCFFDIETTGLSPETSSIYMIGIGFYENNIFRVIQLFADDYNSEKLIIQTFLDYLSNFSLLLQYNGNSFDVPFIRTKCKHHKLDPSPLNEIKHLDLYVALRGFAGLLGLPNKKLKSFEQYVGLDRDDTYNGGELIQVYSEYMQKKIMHKENEHLLKLLLLHNYEDITGLSQVASLMFLKELDNLPINHIKSEYTQDAVNITYECSLPADYSFSLTTAKGIICNWSNSTITLTIPIRELTLKYYFSDYKDYYYLIKEDKVIHKSVAVYTDSKVRRKAKKSECFVAKTGLFLPVDKHGCFSLTMHVFKDDYTSKEYYIEFKESLLNDPDLLETYYRQIR